MSLPPIQKQKRCSNQSPNAVRASCDMDTASDVPVIIATKEGQLDGSTIVEKINGVGSLKTTSTNNAGPSSSELKLNRDNGPHRKPNSSLTPSERDAKRALKRKLKFQMRINKLEKRIRHSISRKDPVVEERTREELRLLLLERDKSEAEETGVVDVGMALDSAPTGHPKEGGGPSTRNEKYDGEVSSSSSARSAVLDVCNRLFIHARSTTSCDSPHHAACASNSTGKARNVQTEAALPLLRHMTKGTQSPSMFRDPDALWGYARQKFYERALLVTNSLGKLAPSDRGGSELVLATGERELRQRAWRRLVEVKTACSVGCGPGCDAVGLLSFLRTFAPTANLGSMLLLDFAIDSWEVVLSPLRTILLAENWNEIEVGFCDVTESLNSERNRSARICLLGSTTNPTTGTEGSDNVEEEVPIDFMGWDMVLISYLLSETRDKWDTFITDLVGTAKTGTMFYFAEPTPWQLHRVRDLCGDMLDFIWLDSSMDRPELQPLDGRVGPGVMFAMKR